MFGITVKGGTHAGWRRQKPAPLWTHRCPAVVRNVAGMQVEQLVPLTSYSCPGCGARRPA